MFKLLTIFACSFATLLSPVQAESNTQTLSAEVETVVEEETFQESSYLYYENGIEYIVTLKSESDALVEITYKDGTVETFETYYLFPGDVLSIMRNGNIWKQFIVAEDGITLVQYTIPTPDEGEDLGTFIEKLLQNKEITKFASAFLAYLVANLGAIVIFIINVIRTKKKAIDRDTMFQELRAAKDEVEIKLRKEYEVKFDAYQSEIASILKSLENKVVGKIDANEAERKEELAKQTLSLESTIKAVQKKASIDEILGE